MCLEIWFSIFVGLMQIRVSLILHLMTCVQACSGDQSYLILCDPMDCSLLGSSVHGVFQQEYQSRLPLPTPSNDMSALTMYKRIARYMWSLCSYFFLLAICTSFISLNIQRLWRVIWRVLKKRGIKLSCDPEIPLLSIQPEKTTIKKRHMYPNVHWNTVYSSQDMEATQMSIYR